MKQIILYMLLALFCIPMGFGCRKAPKVQPRIQVMGYKPELVFEEVLNNLDQWRKEGPGSVVISPDSEMVITDSSGNEGTAVWCLTDVDENFHLEYEIGFNDSSGLSLLFLCAAGIKYEDMFSDLPARNGSITEYANPPLRNYQISYHSFDEGQHYNHTKIRKNPGNLLLSNIEEDPCIESRNYYINVIKISNRIQMYVDGQLVHDVKDKGAFGHSVYLDGKFGFWTQGWEKESTITIAHVRLFKLIPH